METKICLDTDFLVNFLRNKPKEVEWIESHKNLELATTHINIFELYYGAHKSANKGKNVQAVSSLVNSLRILNFSLESTKKAGELLAFLEEKGQPIDFRDLFIGTIALDNKYSMKTYNLKHFERIPNLKIFV